MRYRRQSLVPEIGKKGQTELQNARVLFVGMGGLGNTAALYLAGAGVGTLGLIDGDHVSISNLHRQILFSASDVGVQKVLAAKKHLHSLNPDLQIETYDFELKAQNAIEIFSKYDLILDGTDRFSTKLLINDACLKLKLPWIYASVSQWEGQTALFHSKISESPCYRCFQPGMPKTQIQNCAEGGVIGPVVGILGTHQALQCIQTLVGLAPDQTGHLHIFDGLHHEWMKVKISKNQNCPSCSKAPSEISLIDEIDPACDSSSVLHFTSKELTLNNSELLKSLVLIDVRDYAEWEAFHLEGALHWPLAILEKKAFPDLSKDQKLLVYCQSGKRSKAAALLLKEHGFQSVAELKEGLSEWGAC